MQHSVLSTYIHTYAARVSYILYTEARAAASAPLYLVMIVKCGYSNIIQINDYFLKIITSIKLLLLNFSILSQYDWLPLNFTMADACHIHSLQFARRSIGTTNQCPTPAAMYKNHTAINL